MELESGPDHLIARFRVKDLDPPSPGWALAQQLGALVGAVLVPAVGYALVGWALRAPDRALVGAAVMGVVSAASFAAFHGARLRRVRAVRTETPRA